MKLRAGDAAGALAAYEESLPSPASWRSGQGQHEWQRDVSVSLEKLGDFKLRAGDAAGALAAYEESLAIRRKLVEADKGNTSGSATSR